MLKCKNYLYFALFALSALFVGSFIILTPNVNASPVTYTVDSSNYSSAHILCGSNTVSCSDYKSVSFSYDLTSSSLSPINISSSFSVSFSYNVIFPSFTRDFSSSYRVQYSSKVFYYFDDFSLGSFAYESSINVSNFYSSGGKILITFYDSDPMQGINPSGTLDVTENGTFDVTNYASVSVDVPETECPTCPSGGSNNYHDDLVNIQKSIIICGAILLVLYFFYCIYRLIIRNSGVH